MSQPAPAVHYIEARHTLEGSMRWGAWKLRQPSYGSARKAVRERDIFLDTKRGEGELWQARVVTFSRSRVYQERQTW